MTWYSESKRHKEAAEVRKKRTKTKYTRDFKKIVYGYIEVFACSPEEAQRKFDNGQEDEFDNKSEYEWGKWSRAL